MPLFGLFPKKPKTNSPSANNSDSLSTFSSASRTEEEQYALAKVDSPLTSPSLRLDRPHRSPASTMDRTSPATLQTRPPRSSSLLAPPLLEVTIDTNSLEPPPTRSSVFGAYVYPEHSRSSRSTQSLPDDTITSHFPSSRTLNRPPLATHQRARSSSSTDMPALDGKPPQKSNKMFGWMSFKSSKSNLSQSLPLSPSTSSTKDLPPPPAKSQDPSSFKVNSFRHVRPVSPGPSTPYGSPGHSTRTPPPPRKPSSPSPNLLPPSSTSSTTDLDAFSGPIPRPRRESTTSNASSQRISVAAFRQAQARRSSINLTSSPAPSIGRASIAGDSDVPPLPSTRASPSPRRPPLSVSRSGENSSPERSLPSPASWTTFKVQSSPQQSTFTSDSAPPSPAASGLERQDTVKPRSSTLEVPRHHNASRQAQNSKAPGRPPRNPRPSILQPKSSQLLSPPLTSSPSEISTSTSGQTSGSWSSYMRSSASASTPALPTNLHMGQASRVTADSDTDEDTADSNSSDDDDAPLASTVLPKRPGTSMSTVSTSFDTRSQSTARPRPQHASSQPVTSRPRASTNLSSAPNFKRSNAAPLVNLSKTPMPPSSRLPNQHPLPSSSSRSSDLNIPSSIKRVASRSSDLNVPSSIRPVARTSRQSTIDSSPASSTGDSSSAQHPLTPRDGSEPNGSMTEWRRGASVAGSESGPGTASLVHGRKSSVTFSVSPPAGKGKTPPSGSPAHGKDAEIQRRDRRRSEARAAIELGNVVNGPPPVINDAELLAQYPGAAAAQQQQQQWEAWQMQQARMSQAMFAPPPAALGFSIPQLPPNADPQLIAAHQQALLIAKQTYQFTVAQQALQAANDEWERSSNVTAFNNMGGSASVYGGGGGGMGGMGMSMFPPAPRSMFGGSASVMGGGGGPPSAWGGGAASVYGGPFNPPNGVAFPQNRQSSAMSEYGGGGLPRPRARARTGPSQPAPSHAASRATAKPPSSWRQGS